MTRAQHLAALRRVADGQTDATAALQAHFDAGYTFSEIPSGEYRAERGIVLPPKRPRRPKSDGETS